MQETMEERMQFCEKIDCTLQSLKTGEYNSIEVVIDKLIGEICFWDSAGVITRDFLTPLKNQTLPEVIDGLEYIKMKYLNQGDAFFSKW